MIAMNALDDIGTMNDQLFIDYVDTEWCIRAKRRGYQLYGAGSATMSHTIGNDAARLFGVKMPIHSPFRYYYMLRNATWLLRQPWVSTPWRIALLRRMLLTFITFSLFVGNRLDNINMMTLGLWHGIASRMGRLEK